MLNHAFIVYTCSMLSDNTPHVLSGKQQGTRVSEKQRSSSNCQLGFVLLHAVMETIWDCTEAWT